MPSPRDPFIVFCTAAFIVEGVCLFVLWLVAFIRMRHYSLLLLVIVALLSLSFSAIQFVMYYHFPLLLQVLGKQGYGVFYYGFSAAQLLNAALSVIGVATFVTWLCRGYQKSPQET